MLNGLAKFIHYIAQLENYTLAGEYGDIINSAEELIRGKILILKSRKINEINTTNENNL